MAAPSRRRARPAAALSERAVGIERHRGRSEAAREGAGRDRAGAVYQSSSGSFGLWSPGHGDWWLDSYVTDFLIRARELGYDVPDLALGQALDNLDNHARL
jgi:uncharacterized protein YfaS (alpha-2-macroglobulin family)